MFNSLTERLGRTIKNLSGQGRLTEDNVKDTLREVRMALLEADVALPVVKQFIDNIREKALGQEVIGSLSPGQALVTGDLDGRGEQRPQPVGSTAGSCTYGRSAGCW